ncbi:MAG: Crp/Fnr family transcriptional regulator [Nitrosomonas sp.]|nr:Crp/Fnr family transcriptional regulator [Nitrosomonas sp.]
MKISPDPCDNHILCALTKSELNQLIPYLESITISHAEVLFDVYDKLKYLYFPTTAIVSLLNCLEDGSTVEVAMVGNEGLLGVTALMGRNESSAQAIVNQVGHAYRISMASLQTVLARSGGRRSGTLQKMILRYAQTLFVQMSQSAACNRRHTIEQQLSTWLLSSFDRAGTNTLSITQESISYCLGVRRESVTEAAKKLQESGVIQYRRGQIELTNRTGMEIKACECYGVIKGESNILSTDLQAA